MNKILQKILSISLALLYIGTASGFGIIRCDHAGQSQVIFAGKNIESCICKTENSSSEKNKCCSHEDDANNSLSNIYNFFNNSQNSFCCTLIFNKIDESVTPVLKTKNYNSTNYNLLYSAATINQNTDFIFEPNNFIPKNKPSHTALRGNTALIYQFCQMRN